MRMLPVRVYYEDTDAEGVLYHAATIRYLDRGRTEWLRSAGHSLRRMAEAQRRVFAVHSLTVRYLGMGRLDDELTVRTRLSGTGRASLDFKQSLWREQECLAQAEVRVACLDADTGRPAALPASGFDEERNDA